MKGVSSGERGEEVEEFIVRMSDEYLTILCCINVAKMELRESTKPFLFRRG